MSGAVVTESVFAWPGVGGLFTDALAKRDYAVLMAFLMCGSFVVMVLNLVSDLAVRRVLPVQERIDHRVLEVRAPPPGDERIRPPVPAFLLQVGRNHLGQALLHVHDRSVLVEHADLDLRLERVRQHVRSGFCGLVQRSG